MKLTLLIIVRVVVVNGKLDCSVVDRVVAGLRRRTRDTVSPVTNDGESQIRGVICEGRLAVHSEIGEIVSRGSTNICDAGQAVINLRAAVITSPL